MYSTHPSTQEYLTSLHQHVQYTPLHPGVFDKSTLTCTVHTLVPRSIWQIYIDMNSRSPYTLRTWDWRSEYHITSVGNVPVKKKHIYVYLGNSYNRAAFWLVHPNRNLKNKSSYINESFKFIETCINCHKPLASSHFSPATDTCSLTSNLILFICLNQHHLLSALVSTPCYHPLLSPLVISSTRYQNLLSTAPAIVTYYHHLLSSLVVSSTCHDHLLSRLDITRCNQ